MSGVAPKLRFPEFTGDWLRTDFGHLITIGSGQVDPKEEPYADMPHVAPDNIESGSGILKNVQTARQDGITSGKYLFDSNAIVYSKIRPNLNKVARPGYAGVCSADMYPIWNVDGLSDTDFLLQLMRGEDFVTAATAVSRRTGLPKINRPDLSALRVTVPSSLVEQQKIASFLCAVDGKISGLRRKEVALVRFKAGLMQKLFSQKLRFNRDDGSAFPDWKIIPLYEIATIDKGEQLNRDTLDENKAYPVINGGTGPSGFHDSFNTPAETITVSEGGNSCGYVAWQDKPFWRGGHCYAVNPSTSKVSKTFLFQALKSMEKEIMRLRVGSGLPNIQKSDLMKVVVSCPHPDEQRKIADALSAMDAKITAVRLQISKMETFKKGLLQQMFV